MMPTNVPDGLTYIPFPRVLLKVGETIIKGMDMAEEMSDLAKGYGISGAEADKIAAGVDLDGMKTGDKIP